MNWTHNRMRCGTCQAPLPATFASRAITCEYCGAQTLVPEKLWRELKASGVAGQATEHPLVKAEPPAEVRPETASATVEAGSAPAAQPDMAVPARSLFVTLGMQLLAVVMLIALLGLAMFLSYRYLFTG